jgi:hypothetical protein
MHLALQAYAVQFGQDGAAAAPAAASRGLTDRAPRERRGGSRPFETASRSDARACTQDNTRCSELHGWMVLCPMMSHACMLCTATALHAELWLIPTACTLPRTRLAVVSLATQAEDDKMGGTLSGACKHVGAVCVSVRVQRPAPRSLARRQAPSARRRERTRPPAADQAQEGSGGVVFSIRRPDGVHFATMRT